MNMKNNKKKSPMMKIVSAAAMLAVSASMLATSTYAWFAMNTTVSVNGMELKAKAEKGIVITNETPATTGWKESVAASHNGTYTPDSGSATSLAVRPTSTADGAVWYHNISNDIDNAQAGQAVATYTTLSTSVDATTGAGYVDDDTVSGYDPSADSNYYLKNTFYIKSSQAEAITSNVLQVKSCSATAGSGSADLDKALRVAVVVGGNTYIFNPLTGTETYTVAGSTSVTANPGTAAVDTGITTIPNNTATTSNAVKIDVYLYFEGEDANCKSTNLTATLDTVNVELSFGLKNAVNNG
jgi:hypothetical protein